MEQEVDVKHIVQDIANGRVDAAAKKLRQQAGFSDVFPSAWLMKTASALESDNWDILSDSFINMGFIGKEGYFLMIGPYNVTRQCQNRVKLSALYGQVHDFSHPSLEQLEGLVCEKFGTLKQRVTQNLSFHEIASCGHVNDESGEAFVVPNGWSFSNSVCGPALNNAKEQQRRFLGHSHKCIRKIFEPETASLLLAPLGDQIKGQYYRHVDTQVHEAGHASGLGFNFKVQHGLFQNYTYGGIEEWRSDSLGFEFAACLLSPEEAGKLVAVNFCIRFGLDAHRLGGMDKDVDVYASLISLEHLFKNDAIYVTQNGQLALRDLSYSGLLQAVELHRAEALSITRRELELKDFMGLFRLFSVDIHPSTQSIFNGLIREKCQGIWTHLQ